MNRPHSLVALTAAGAAILCPTAAAAQGVSISSERLNTFEEPIAVDLEGITLELNGLVDTRLDFDLDDRLDNTSDVEPGIVGAFNLSAATQLGNRWNVGVAYFGQYESTNGSDDYTDAIAGFISGSYGTALIGEVTDVVREETRRIRGAGNADLRFDGALGAAGNWGGGYVGQFGPARLSGIVDEDGAFDLGFSWQRPSGPAGYRYTARYTHGDYTAADGVSVFDTQAITGTFSYFYGQTTLNLGAGYEHFDNPLASADRWFLSAGAQRQFGDITASIEGHYGEIKGQSEASAAAGLRYNMSRGLSLNLGLNHARADVDLGPVTLIDQEETKATVSLRFGF